MLDSVEAAWHDLSQDVEPEASVSKQELKLPVTPRLALLERLQQLPALFAYLPRPQMPHWQWRWPRLPGLRWQRLAEIAEKLPWWTLFLLAALATFYYVSTL